MVSADTNIAFYALTNDPKAEQAEKILASCDFISVQVLNEYAASSRRKARRDWHEIERDLALLQQWVGDIRLMSRFSNRDALRIADRYQLAFYDALHLAVALAGGATIFYSEDMQHGLIIDDRMTVINPFLPSPHMDAV
jgi:predicted nucleic acid-binding protein